MSGSKVIKKQVVFISGGDSFSDRENFLNHLKTLELRNPTGEESEKWTKNLRSNLGDDFELYQLAMPNKQNAKYDEWKIWFERHLEFLSDGVVLVGWSLGGMFLLKYCTEENLPFRPAVLHVVASPAGDYEIESEPGNDCLSFKFSLETLKVIENKVNKIVLYHSKDDFVVPYEHAIKLKNALPKAELVTFVDRNHFLQANFPELLENIINT